MPMQVFVFSQSPVAEQWYGTMINAGKVQMVFLFFPIFFYIPNIGYLNQKQELKKRPL